MGDITYKKDIIQEVSKELGIPYAEIEEIFNLNISYIKKSVLEKDYVMISLPNLCKIRMNFRLALSSYMHTKNIKTERSSIKLKSLARKIAILRSSKIFNEDLLNYKKPLFERLWKKIDRPTRVKHIYKKMYNIIYELENKTNQIIEKIT